jgi:hypothetical protein
MRIRILQVARPIFADKGFHAARAAGRPALIRGMYVTIETTLFGGSRCGAYRRTRCGPAKRCG